MKNTLGMGLLVVCLFGGAVLAAEGSSPHAAMESSKLTGKVLEVKNVDQYTYLRLKTASGETWAAVEKTALKVGATVTLYNAMEMNNFESKSLHKTFPSILFASLKDGNSGDVNPHGKPSVSASDIAIVKVEKASGPNAYTVAELVTRASELNGKTVAVRAKVMKFNPGIMNKNWIHLSDGSGDAANHSNDILATGNAEVKVGSVVEMSGVLKVDQDFGSGYSYKVLIENAVTKP